MFSFGDQFDLIYDSPLTRWIFLSLAQLPIICLVMDVYMIYTETFAYIGFLVLITTMYNILMFVWFFIGYISVLFMISAWLMVYVIDLYFNRYGYYVEITNNTIFKAVMIKNKFKNKRYKKLKKKNIEI